MCMGCILYWISNGPLRGGWKARGIYAHFIEPTLREESTEGESQRLTLSGPLDHDLRDHVDYNQDPRCGLLIKVGRMEDWATKSKREHIELTLTGWVKVLQSCGHPWATHLWSNQRRGISVSSLQKSLISLLPFSL